MPRDAFAPSRRELPLPANSRCVCHCIPVCSVRRGPTAVPRLLENRMKMDRLSPRGNNAKSATFPGDRRRLRRSRAMLPEETGRRCGASGMPTSVSKFSGVNERDSQQHGAQQKEGKDAIDAFEEGKVVNKDFANHQAEEHQALPAQQGGFGLHATDQESRGVGGPQNGKGKMLCERGIESGAGFSKKIPEFQRQGDKRVDIYDYREYADLNLFLPGDFRSVGLCGPQSDGETSNHYGVGTEAGVE